MFWQEEIDKQTFRVPDDVQDVILGISADVLPVDYINGVANALLLHFPWLESVCASIHPINIPDGNGWYAPKGENSIFYPSKRSKLSIRLPKEKLKELDSLLGDSLNFGEYSIKITKRYPDKKLSSSTIIFAKYIHSSVQETEDDFLVRLHQNLMTMGITPKKMMAGLTRNLTTNNGIIQTRSLMLADLNKKDSVYLQANGTGDYRLLGCGLFVPQKGIDTVDSSS